MKVLMTGGGTGGHVYPALAIADTIKRHEPDSEIAFVGTSHGIENKLGELSFRDAVQSLGEREKKILYLRFFQGKTQIEVANEIGISQAQVSRLEKSALRSIKDSCEGM